MKYATAKGDDPRLSQTGPMLSVAAWAKKLAAELKGAIPREDSVLLGMQAEELARLRVASTSPLTTSSEPTIVRDEEQLSRLTSQISGANNVAVCLETNHPNDEGPPHVVGVGIATDRGVSYVPVGHRFLADKQLLPDQLSLDRVLNVVTLNAVGSIAHGGKLMAKLLHPRGVNSRFAWDTAVAIRLLALDVTDSNGSLSRPLPGETTAIEFLPIHNVAEHCATNLRDTLLLAQNQRNAQPSIQFLMTHVELPLIDVVTQMESNGYPVNRQHFELLRQRLHSELPAVSSTTAAGPLQSALHVCNDVLEHTQADGRYHVEFDQLGTRTGRFTSHSCIQTLPKEDPHRLRHGFRASPDHKIVAADFDQQEMRVLAHLSDDMELRRAFKQNQDVHGFAAKTIFGLDCEPNDVKEQYPELRHRAKAIQFSMIYGRTARGLARELGIDDESAKRLFDDYFRRFVGVKRFIDDMHRKVVQDGYLVDIFGRRCNFPNAQLAKNSTPESGNVESQIAAAKREAQNFVVQATAATITKLAMIRCHERINKEYPDVKMILTLHDELQFEVPERQVEGFAAELPTLMCELGLEKQFGFDVLIQIGIKVGPSMAELKTWRRS